MDDVPAVAVEHVRDRYPSLLDAVGAASDVAAEDWPAAGVADGARVRSSFRDALDAVGVRDALPGVLASTVDALGESLQARPVAAPPYVVVTSTGVLLRATLDDCRLVVELRAFEQRAGRYHRRDSVTVTVRLL